LGDRDGLTAGLDAPIGLADGNERESQRAMDEGPGLATRSALLDLGQRSGELGNGLFRVARHVGGIAEPGAGPVA
jgi:hypothetical protein